MAKKRTSTVKQMTNEEALEHNVSKATERTAATTGQPVSAAATKSFSKADTEPVKQTRRKAGVTAKGRAKFTTMLRTDLREKLANLSQKHQISIADALEQIITEYLGID